MKKFIGAFDLWDAHYYAGLALAALGVALVFAPAGVIVLGAGLAFVGLKGGK